MRITLLDVISFVDWRSIYGGTPAARRGPESVAVAVLSPVLEFSAIFRVLSGDRVGIGSRSGGPVLEFSTILLGIGWGSDPNRELGAAGNVRGGAEGLHTLLGLVGPAGVR